MHVISSIGPSSFYHDKVASLTNFSAAFVGSFFLKKGSTIYATLYFQYKKSIQLIHLIEIQIFHPIQSP